ncbi:stage V sporulation protein K [Rossellomorea marisflavi]|jgi:stage V sporulation protein K|uniref:Stage V sporulation protein K n=2 Tax=Bacillaceae TaxID=186817 RepID=A0A0M0GT76_9BACI|nr:stage V sporulation protein K [Rossellomorea marisflavi]MBV6683364.1 stage V sporulation protein K [Bacillus sp. JRC01]KON92692.1 stage V sporulation protein K [Rossellomorea marisflavi]MCM2588811.1 stage V sporulation protein K [Rossellomorea marisflavi]MDR4937055.1 stage V sporulation protein K [Rossellomorea marisflavi]MDW4526604.1 stage V sporulation protein K [Rossellomorea marisflavi]
MRMKNNGQISIVLNSQKRNPLRDTMIQESIPQSMPQEHAALKEIEEELGTLIGMDEMKKMVKEIYAWIYVNKKREMMGLKAGKQALHMMFKGNPGTGKTTVARIIGKLFLKMNVLSKGHLIEAERADLVGEYIGHTAQKTRDLVKKALGGILFVDEAYSLGRGGEKDFGKEAIDTLVKHMEDKQHEFILILAGYSKEMDHFLTLNPGLQSRFPLVFHFPDYSVDQLMDISKLMLKEKEYMLSHDAERKIREHLHGVKNAITANAFSNGRYVRNILEKSIRAHAMRLLMENNYDRHELMTLRSNDLVFTRKDSD